MAKIRQLSTALLALSLSCIPAISFGEYDTEYSYTFRQFEDDTSNPDKVTDHFVSATFYQGVIDPGGKPYSLAEFYDPQSSLYLTYINEKFKFAPSETADFNALEIGGTLYLPEHGLKLLLEVQKGDADFSIDPGRKLDQQVITLGAGIYLTADTFIEYSLQKYDAEIRTAVSTITNEQDSHTLDIRHILKTSNGAWLEMDAGLVHVSPPGAGSNNVYTLLATYYPTQSTSFGMGLLLDHDNDSTSALLGIEHFISSTVGLSLIIQTTEQDAPGEVDSGAIAFSLIYRH